MVGYWGVSYLNILRWEAYKIIGMSLKYRRSIIFDQPHQTTAKMALETLVFDCKQRLQLNSRNKSEP